MHYIGLLDCNNFFVSCERLFRPDLLGKPVVVLSGNDGCVVARSQEVKALGVPMGIPYFQVKQELAAAHTTVFSSNFALYRDISRRVMQVLHQEVGMVEQYSVDEAFFSLSVPEASIGVASERLLAIKRVVERSVGVPVSIGLARTKTIAKYAAEKEKRGRGVCVLVGESWHAETSTIPLNTIWGIGAKTSQKMTAHGLHTVTDLVAADPARIRRLFGVVGERQRAELMEVVAYPLGAVSKLPQSLMSTRSFQHPTTDPQVVLDALLYHASHIAAELRTKGLQAGSLSIMATPSRHGDWVLRGGSLDRELTVPSNDTFVLQRLVQDLWQKLYESTVPYKKAGVVVSGLRSVGETQLRLFSETASTARTQSMMPVLDSLNQRFGDGIIAVGRVSGKASWQPRAVALSPHYTTQWDNLRTIKAT